MPGKHGCDGGGVDGIISAAEAVLSRANTKTRLIPGHGDVASPADLRGYRDMLVSVRDRVQLMVNDGKTEEEVVAAHPTRDHDGVWGENSERMVRAVFRSLSDR